MTAYSAPATKAAPVVPSDTLDATTQIDARALYVGTTGNIRGILKDDVTNTPITFTAVPVGTLEISFKYILATSTTATNLVALY